MKPNTHFSVNAPLAFVYYRFKQFKEQDSKSSRRKSAVLGQSPKKTTVPYRFFFFLSDTVISVFKAGFTHNWAR